MHVQICMPQDFEGIKEIKNKSWFFLLFLTTEHWLLPDFVLEKPSARLSSSEGYLHPPLSVCCFYDKLTDAQAFVVVGRDTVDTEVCVKLRGEPFLSPLAINAGLSHHPKYLTHKRYH